MYLHMQLEVSERIYDGILLLGGSILPRTAISACLHVPMHLLKRILNGGSCSHITMPMCRAAVCGQVHVCVSWSVHLLLFVVVVYGDVRQFERGRVVAALALVGRFPAKSAF
jgi:hypothetical protein